MPQWQLESSTLSAERVVSIRKQIDQTTDEPDPFGRLLRDSYSILEHVSTASRELTDPLGGMMREED